MIVRKLRLQNGWSQEQLAELSGLSIRTIQRIERGQTPSLESLKSIAAVFQITVADLQQEQMMNKDVGGNVGNNVQESIRENMDENGIPSEAKTISDVGITKEEQIAIDQVRAIKSFYSHLACYVAVMVLLFTINVIFTPWYIWAWWSALGWGIGVISHGISAFELFDPFGPEWEKRQVEKRLGRKM